MKYFNFGSENLRISHSFANFLFPKQSFFRKTLKFYTIRANLWHSKLNNLCSQAEKKIL